MSSPNVKEEGSYYTPEVLAHFLAYHMLANYTVADEANVLEPSIGDGVFVDALLNNQYFQDKTTRPTKVNIDGVEISPSVAKNLNKYMDRYRDERTSINIVNKDYLDYEEESNRRYDLIIGNPPYIKRSYLSKHQSRQCERIHQEAGLGNKKIKNIWTAFLMSCASKLKPTGAMCLVLPAELLQVIYAKELRDYLKYNFERIEIFTFNDLVFNGIDQDVVVLICAKNSHSRVTFYHVDKLDDLKKPEYITENSNIHRKTLDKWTNYILTDTELSFLDSLKDRLNWGVVDDFSRSTVGIVTAANNYFILSSEKIREESLESVGRPIIQKASNMPTSLLRFNESDLKDMINSSKPSFFLHFPDKPYDSLANTEKKYLNFGVAEGINQRYKCRLRNNWYAVPSVWAPEVFFTKRSHIFPRMVINDAHALVTDAFYRVKINDGTDLGGFVFSFYNTITFIYAELEGRYYGGSVLELTPNEFKRLPLLYTGKIDSKNLDHLDHMLRSGASVVEILSYTNSIILREFLGLSKEETAKLMVIYGKLVKRRLKKHQVDI